MQGNHSVAETKNSYSLTGVTWSFIFMMVFCFAGCAAGSCLSYGHSCWGAHGKRSGNSFGSNNLGPLSIHEINEESNRNIASPLENDRWMLSPLIAKRHQIPPSGKYRVKWFDILKGRGLPRDWDNDSMASKEENDVIREHNEKFLKNKGSEGESKESEIFPREMTESFIDDDSAEIILLPRRRGSNDKSRLRFIKVMGNTDANLK